MYNQKYTFDLDRLIYKLLNNNNQHILHMTPYICIIKYISYSNTILIIQFMNVVWCGHFWFLSATYLGVLSVL